MNNKIVEKKVMVIQNILLMKKENKLQQVAKLLRHFH